jgi:hypothetical protein
MTKSQDHTSQNKAEVVTVQKQPVSKEEQGGHVANCQIWIKAEVKLQTPLSISIQHMHE